MSLMSLSLSLYTYEFLFGLSVLSFALLGMEPKTRGTLGKCATTEHTPILQSPTKHHQPRRPCQSVKWLELNWVPDSCCFQYWVLEAGRSITGLYLFSTYLFILFRDRVSLKCCTLVPAYLSLPNGWNYTYVPPHRPSISCVKQISGERLL